MSMTINDLIDFILTTDEWYRENTGDFDWMDFPISVAFKDRDRVAIISNITSICFNGKSIQLNEDKYDAERDLE
tara:strand:+ start:133 stop:354 length:222 start_codon:yes stop_codon:yes gene_type:complete